MSGAEFFGIDDPRYYKNLSPEDQVRVVNSGDFFLSVPAMITGRRETIANTLDVPPAIGVREESRAKAYRLAESSNGDDRLKS